LIVEILQKRRSAGRPALDKKYYATVDDTTSFTKPRGSFDDDTVSGTDEEQPQPHDADCVEVVSKKVKKIRSKSNGGETCSFD
jgi:hypothetical protein